MFLQGVCIASKYVMIYSALSQLIAGAGSTVSLEEQCNHGFDHSRGCPYWLLHTWCHSVLRTANLRMCCSGTICVNHPTFVFYGILELCGVRHQRGNRAFSIVPMLLLLLFCQNKAICCIFAWPQGYRLYSRIKRQRGLFVQELNNDYIHNPHERDMVKQPLQGLQSLGTCIRDHIYRLYINGWILKTTEFFNVMRFHCICASLYS